MVEKIINGELDIPTSFVSSIGEIVWPPKETNNGRLKGIFPNPINDEDLLVSFLNYLNELKFPNETSRITARALVSKEALLNFNHKSPYSSLIETIIPLDGEIFGNFCLVYFGKNAPQRICPEEIINRQYQNALYIFNECTRLTEEKNTDNNNFEILLIDDSMRRNRQIIEMYYQLYSNFGWSKEEVSALIRNPSNLLIAAINNNQRIVSSGLVEFASIDFNGLPEPLKIAEITEAATLEEFRGRGLYRRVSNQILEILSNQQNPPDLVFGESNLDAPGVLKVAAQQGRIPALKTAQDFNLPHAWILPQHVSIFQENRPSNYPYNNLMVTYLTQERLKGLWKK